MLEPTPPPLPRSPKPAALWRESLEAHDDVENGVQGLGGWLLLFAFSLVIATFASAFALLTLGTALAYPGAWAHFTDPASSGYHPLWATTLVYEVVGNGLRLLLCLALLAVFFTRRRVFRALALIYLAASVIFVWGDHLLSQQIPAVVAAHANNRGPGAHVQITLYALIWVPYLLISKRVKNTFVR